MDPAPTPDDVGVVDPAPLGPVPAPVRRKRIYPEIPADILFLLQRGKLDQICPECGRQEAAHWYCSRCYREMIPTDWKTWSELHPERAAALRERALASGSRERFAAIRAAQTARRAKRAPTSAAKQSRSQRAR